MISKLIKKGNELVFSVTAKNIYLVSSGNLVSIIAGFIFNPFILTRTLSVSDYGVFAALSSFILILSDFTEFGFGAGLSNFIPPLLKANKFGEVNKIIKTTFIIQLGLALTIGLLIIIFSQSISQLLFGNTYQIYVRLVGWSSVGVIGYMLFNFSVSQFVAKEAFNKVFSIQSLQAVIKVIFSLLYLLIATLNIRSILAIFILAPIVTVILIASKFIQEAIKEKGRYSVKKLLSFNIFLALNKLFVVLFSRLDILMLTALSSTYEAGLYSIASRVAFIYPLIGGSVGTVFGPKYAKLTLNEALSFTKKSMLIILLLIVSLLVLILISPVLIPFVFTSSYTNSVPVLQILLLGTIPFLLAIPTNNLLTYSLKKPHILAVSSFVQLFIVLIFNYIFIPKYGAFGPAISIGMAALTSLVISFCVTFYEYAKVKGK